MSVDMLGMPADAPHPENALRFIDYLLRPAVIADITNAVSSPTPICRRPRWSGRKSATTRRSTHRRNPPPPLHRSSRAAAYERARTRAWTRLKSGR